MARPWPILGAGAALLLGLPLLAFFTFLAVAAPPTADFQPLAWSPPAVQAFPATPALPQAMGEALYGPEDIAFDSAGRLYTGTRDGIIWRLAPGGEPERFAETGGRPLGLTVLPDGRLIVANHGIGLQQVDPDGTVTTLAAEADGLPINFANDLDVSRAGIVYFSDSSQRYNTATLGDASSSYLFPDMIDGRPSGRVLAHNLLTGETSTLADGLHFPNGIALTADEQTLWIAESNRYRILALDLAAGSPPSVLVDNLPGTPDNLGRAADGTMLLALYDRVAVVDKVVLPLAPVREVIARLPVSLFVNEERPLSGSVLALDNAGTVLDWQTGITPAPTTAVERQGQLYLGALLTQPIRQLPR